MSEFEQYFHEATQFQFKTWETALNNNPMLKAGRDFLVELDRLVPGSESLIVGGSVRDLVLGHELKDVDIATNININRIAQHFKTDDIGKSKNFGIVNVHYQGYEFEVANFRTEEGYTDKRRPDKVNIAKSYEQDSARRDFTINALGINKNGQIVDYHNGLEDLKNGLIRTVGDARLRFTEDALRIYRLFRFAAKNGFSIEPNTLKAAEELVQLGQTDSLAIERITDELFKAAGNGVSLAKYIEHLDRSGLLEKILPEISALKGLKHPLKHHPEGAWVEKI